VSTKLSVAVVRKEKSKARAEELRDDARSYDDAHISAPRGSRRTTGDSSIDGSAGIPRSSYQRKVWWHSDEEDEELLIRVRR
jgi:hypothetical protein